MNIGIIGDESIKDAALAPFLFQSSCQEIPLLLNDYIIA
jgi:hypothetical protein